MKQRVLGFLVTAALAIPSTLAFSAQEPDILVRVDGRAITRAQVLAANPQAATNTVVANQTAQALINRILLVNAAQHAGLPEQPSVRAALQSARDSVLEQAALSHYLQQHPIDEAEIKQQYDAMVKANPAHQYRVRMIVVSSRELADKIVDQLKAGSRFSDLAAEHSTGPNAALGGELGWVLRPQLQASVGSTLEKLKPGQVTAPVVVPEGWAIVQLLQVRPTEVLPLDAVRPAIEQQLRTKLENDYIAQLRAQAKIEVMHTAQEQPAAASSPEAKP